MILFLDFDGVLHPDPCPDQSRLFENAPRLVEVLEEFPDLGVVLSTSWRTVCSQAELLAALPPQLRSRVLGANPRRSDFKPAPVRLPYRRHAECEEWLRMHGMPDSPWLALDDRADGFAPFCERLLLCDARIGFDPRVQAQLRAMLTLARRRRGAPVDVVLA